MKSYTDLQQSKKLTEILPHKSADMKWFFWKEEIDAPKLPTFGYSKSDVEFYKNTEAVYLPCWSLAALLDIIRKLVGYSLQSLDTHTVFMNCELGDKPYNIETKNYDNPIDACYEMIIRLNELNLL